MGNIAQSGFVLRTTDTVSSFRRYGKRLVFALTLTGAAFAAWGGTSDKSLSVVVSPLPAAVSYSKTSLGQKTFAAYKVTVKSLVKNGLNNVWFKASGSSTIKQFSEGYGCLIDDATINTSLTCKLGAIAFNDPKTFVIVLNVPDAGAPACVANDLGDECVQLNWQVANGQGNANDQPSESQFSQKKLVETAVSDATTTGSTSRVESYILTGGGVDPTTETGVLSTQLADAKAKTTVKVPKDSPVFIEQTETSATRGSCQNIYVLCLMSELRIQEGGTPVPFGNIVGTALAISLYRDVSTLKNANTSIDKAVLRYSENGRTFTDIQACNLDYTVDPLGTPVLPPGQVNCLVSRAVEGSLWKFNLIASQNGFREF